MSRPYYGAINHGGNLFRAKKGINLDAVDVKIVAAENTWGLHAG